MNLPGWYPYGASPAALGARWSAALMVMGLECWVLAAVAPRLQHPSAAGPELADVIAVLAPLIALGLGATLPPGRVRPAAVALLLGFPALLAASAAVRPELTVRDAWGPMSTGLLSVSLAAYIALALVHVGRPAALRPASPQPLPPESHQPASERFRNGRFVLAAVMGAALIGIGVVPFWQGRAETVARFGAAADDAAVLAVIVGTLLFTIVVGAILGPGLRARKRTDPRRERRMAAALPYVVLAATAAIGRVVLYYLDRS